jgi:TetR/AcrR family transcriptional regulator, regulator of autoinduction and epiphytic fitness
MLAPTDARSDGRLARGERARGLVVGALLELVREGDLRPTAPRIAERARVSLRTVFHHFADLEALFAAAADRQTDDVQRLVVPVPHGGDLSARLDAFVQQRARLLEAITPVRRAALLMEPFSKEIASRLAETRGLGMAEVTRVFARELAKRPAAARRDLAEALHATSCFPTWETLRRHQGLPVPRARRVMRRMLAALLAMED